MFRRFGLHLAYSRSADFRAPCINIISYIREELQQTPPEQLDKGPRTLVALPLLSDYRTRLCRGHRDTGRVISGTDVPLPGLPEYKPNSPEYEPKSPKYEPPEPTAKTVILGGVTDQNGASKAGNYT